MACDRVDGRVLTCSNLGPRVRLGSHFASVHDVDDTALL